MNVKYDEKLAENYWTQRLKKTKDKMKVVLSYNEPEYVNNAYSVWELNTVAQDVIQNFDVSSTIADIGCFVPNTKITMGDFTVKNIEDVNIGDEVLTHTGKIKKVLKVMKRKYNGKIFKIKSGSNIICATPEHPIFSMKKQQSSKIGFNSISSLNKMDFIATPIPTEIKNITIKLEKMSIKQTKHKEINNVIVSPELLRLFGYYLAEGSMVYSHKNHPAGISFCFNIDEMKYIDDICSLLRLCKFDVKITIKKRENKNIVEIYVYSRDIGRLFLMMCGEHSHEKVLSKDLLFIEPKYQLELLKGIFRGDGHFSSRKRIDKKGIHNELILKTMSEKLAHQVFWMLTRNQIKSSLSRDKDIFIIRLYGKEISKIKDEEYVIENKFNKTKFVMFSNNILNPIEKKEEINYDGVVYNLNVEDDNSYVANNISVHNCGWGRVSLFFAEKGFKVESVDISQEMLENLKKEKEEIECKTKKKLNITIRHGSCEKLPFEDSSIDVVLMLGLLEHLPSEIRKNAIKEAHRVLKLNGKAYFVLNNSESCFLQKVERYEMKKQDDSGYFVGLMNFNDMINFLNEVGFATFYLSSNYHQSLARHYLLEGCDNKKVAENIMTKSAIMDIQYPVNNKKIVDQNIYVAVKTNKLILVDPSDFIIHATEQLKKMNDFMINSTKMFV